MIFLLKYPMECASLLAPSALQKRVAQLAQQAVCEAQETLN